jgi:hypothetical protein
MLGVGETLPDFKIVGVKPKFKRHEENGESAFEPLTKASFRQVEGDLLLPEGLHLRLPDRDRRVCQAEPAV